MAIIIPSKNIYQIDDKKVISNEIDYLQVEQQVVSVKRNFGEEIYRADVTNNSTSVQVSTSTTQQSNFNIQFEGLGQSNIQWRWAVAGIQCIAEQRFVDEIAIFLEQGNKTIQSVLTGVDKEGNPNIQVSLSGKINKGKTTNYLYTNRPNDSAATQKANFNINWDNTQFEEEESAEDSFQVDYNITNNYRGTWKRTSYQPSQFDVSTSVSFEGIETLSTAKAVINEFTATIRDLRFLSGIKIINLNSNFFYDDISSDRWHSDNNLGYYVEMEGTYEEYIPTEVKLVFNGNTVELDLEENTITIGDGAHKQSFNGNEIMQSENTPSVEETYKKVFEEWKSGKENITLRCAIDDYFDEDGKKAISKTTESSLPMTLKIGDEIIPYKHSAQGLDTAISLYKNGQPKKFAVVSKNMIFDGSVVQEIVAQEIPMK